MIYFKDVEAVIERMKHVKRKILVLSGKGGVGKSTFSANFARALCKLDTRQKDNQTTTDADDDDDSSSSSTDSEDFKAQVCVVYHACCEDIF